MPNKTSRAVRRSRLRSSPIATSRAELDRAAHDNSEASRGGRRGRLTVARALKLASVASLVTAGVTALILFSSIQSIDKTFHDVVAVDQPSQEVATDMIASADEAIIIFLESLVSHTSAPTVDAEAAFTQSMKQYQVLVSHMAAEDYSALAKEIFGIVKDLGRDLVRDDQERQRSFAAVRELIQRMDETAARSPHLAPLQVEAIDTARWIANYVAAPSVAHETKSIMQVNDFIEGISDARRAFRGKLERSLVSSLMVDAHRVKRAQEEIILMTERSEIAIAHFLRTRERLDAVLDEGISLSVSTSLKRRSAQAEQSVETSKTVLGVSLGVGVLLGLGALLWVRRRITQPVTRLMTAIDGLGAMGVPTETEVFRNDEFGVLARALRDADAHRRGLEGELRQQALHDPLTGLANRALFKDRVEHAASRGNPDGKTVAVVFIDIDDFKTINDSLGHAAGDELLVTVAQRIQECLRTDDTAARLGGDEFAILLEDVADMDDVAIPAQRILDALAEPIEVESKWISVYASLGIALHKDGQGAAELLRDADSAMYGAKSNGKGHYIVFDETMHFAAVQRFELKNELASVIDKGELRLHYQPVIDLATGQKEMVEALIRWEHPDRGTVSPGEFIPLAEETGSIVPIGRWVLETACEQAVDWRRSSDATHLRMCVNVSPRQLKDKELVADVRRALERSGLPADALVLEITENISVLNDDAVVQTLDDLAELGVVIAMDDFGSGYSSLGYLSRLPIGILKIDRSFVNGIDRGAQEIALAHAIIRLGEALNLEIIAEGIETPTQLAELKRRGCHLGQGFLLGRPAPVETLESVRAGAA